MLPSTITCNAPNARWFGLRQIPKLLACSLSKCQKYNHNYHEDTSWQLPKELNEVQFAVEFWEDETEVAQSFNSLLYKWFLALKVRLIFKDLFVAVIFWHTFFWHISHTNYFDRGHTQWELPWFPLACWDTWGEKEGIPWFVWFFLHPK